MVFQQSRVSAHDRVPEQAQGVVPASLRREQIQVCASAKEVGKQAAEKLVSLLEAAVEKHSRALLVLACAPSQHETWDHLIPMLNQRPGLTAKLTFVNMDDYQGVHKDHEQSFSGILERQFFAKLEPKPHEERVFLLQGDAVNTSAEAQRISQVIQGFNRSSIVVMGGFGTDGHLAFDDYPVTGPDKSGHTPLVTVREIKREAREQQVTDGCFTSLEQVPTHCFTLTNWFFRVWARGGIVLAAKGKHKQDAASSLILRPTEKSPVTLLYQALPQAGDLPCTPHIFLDPHAGAGIRIAEATSVMPSAPCRVFGCGKLPLGLLWRGIEDGRVFLTTGDQGRASLQLPITLKARGLFQESAVQPAFEIGTFNPDFSGDLLSASQLAAVDHSRGCTIVSSNNQEYFFTDSEGKRIPSNFAKNIAAYLAKRFQIDPQKTLHIAPLELFRDNGERLYEAVLSALQSADVVAHLGEEFDKGAFETFLKDTCCWYNTIDDRIVTDRDEQDGRLTVKTEPYATLHYAKAKQSVDKHEYLESPFVANGTSVQEVQDLQPYISRKLGLLNAVHVCAVIECLRTLGIDNYQQIRDQEHVNKLLTDDYIVRNLFTNRTSDSFLRIDSAARAILMILKINHPGGDYGFDQFLKATYDRFANPAIDHKLRDIFQGMDKFPPKIAERIGYFIGQATNPNSTRYADVLKSPEYEELCRFFSFNSRIIGGTTNTAQ